jgi:hypothetical protein
MRDLWPEDWRAELRRVFDEPKNIPRVRVVFIGMDGNETGEVLYFQPVETVRANAKGAS